MVAKAVARAYHIAKGLTASPMRIAKLIAEYFERAKNRQSAFRLNPKGGGNRLKIIPTVCGTLFVVWYIATIYVRSLRLIIEV